MIICCAVDLGLTQVVLFYVICVLSVAWLFLLGCQYQCKRLPGKTGLRNGL